MKTYITIKGKNVDFGCEACIKDLEYRIEDMKTSRDQQAYRTDSRVHYNGVLRILRRMLRAAKRQQINKLHAPN